MYTTLIREVFYVNLDSVIYSNAYLIESEVTIPSWSQFLSSRVNKLSSSADSESG